MKNDIGNKPHNRFNKRVIVFLFSITFLLNSAIAQTWNYDGNAVDTVRKIGTTNGYDLPFITNNAERMRFLSSGNMLIGTTTDAASALVNINSTTKGLLIPRMTSSQRDAISSPATGLKIYNTTLNTFDFYNGVSWMSYGKGAGTGTLNSTLGVSSLINNTTGSSNIAIGDSSLRANTTGTDNIALGALALKANVTGSFSVAIGSRSLIANTASTSINTAVGAYTLYSNVSGTRNVAIGLSALQNSTSSYDVAVGSYALYTATNNQNGPNTAIGYSALLSMTTGKGNTGVGNEVLKNNTTGLFNSAFGYQSMFSGTNSSAMYNAAVGYQSLFSVSTASNNTSIGAYSLYQNTSGSNNVGIGFKAGYGETSSSNKLFIANTSSGNLIYGDFSTGQVLINTDSLHTLTASAQFEIKSTTKGLLGPVMTTTQRNAITSPATGLEIYNSTKKTKDIYNGTSWISLTGSGLTSGNIAIGSAALDSITTGLGNVAIGDSSLRVNTTGNTNTAIGKFSLTSLNTSSNGNVAIGSNALYSLTTSISGGSQIPNTAIGTGSMANTTTGTGNSGLGNSSLYYNTTGANNTAVGYFASLTNTNGSDNVAFGTNALKLNSHGNKNVALGKNALNNATGSNNIAIGYQAGYQCTGDSSVFIGYQAGYNETGSNKLYIANSNTSTPLIGGDFTTGNVGIGTASPNANAKLDVVGNIFASGKVVIGTTGLSGADYTSKLNDATIPYALAVNGNAVFTKARVRLFGAWPDFVFADKYGLLPIAKLDEYIKEHRHLPGVPSSEDVEKNGIDLGDNQTILLQKVEELTLYIIEQDKKFKQQQQQIDELKNMIKENKHHE